jgi:hypothetical protein
MATQYFAYIDDAGTTYPLPLTDAQQAVYPVFVGVLPTAYATAAALLAAISGSIALPAGLAPRSVTLTQAFFGSALLPVLTAAQFNAIEPTGATPLPKAPISWTDAAYINGASGETRLSN